MKLVPACWDCNLKKGTKIGNLSSNLGQRD